jgi:hypothetical protein
MPVRSFPAPATGGGNIARAHEVANVLLEELVVAVELVVFLLDGLYAVEEQQKGFLQCPGMPVQFLACFPTHLVKVLAIPPGAHGSDIVGLEVYGHRANLRGALRYDESATALAAREPRARRNRRVDFVALHRRARGGVCSLRPRGLGC